VLYLSGKLPLRFNEETARASRRAVLCTLDRRQPCRRSIKP
jgi:hypothetical protein